jgi:hypothetical protein
MKMVFHLKGFIHPTNIWCSLMMDQALCIIVFIDEVLKKKLTFLMDLKYDISLFISKFSEMHL